MKTLLKVLIKKLFKKVTETPKLYETLLGMMTEFGRPGEFFTYHLRPKRVLKSVNDKIPVTSVLPNTAIILQGPVLYRDNFTEETLALYRNWYPSAKIILSVWDDENAEFLSTEERKGTIVVRNVKPESGGFINLNYQLVSTLGGIKKAQELGCTHILKSRTDNRIYQSGFLEFLYSLLKQFPVNCSNQTERIIGVDINTHKYGIGISDLFQFGHINDMLKMWDVPLSTNRISRKEYVESFEPTSTAKTRFELEYSECFILKRFMENLGSELKPTLESYYITLKNQFIIIDATSIGLFFCKYLDDEYAGVKNYNKILSWSAFTFSDWLILYTSSGLNPNEKVMDVTSEFWKEKTICDL